VGELKTFISHYNIGVMLISETHFTDKSYLKLRNHTVYHTVKPELLEAEAPYSSKTPYSTTN
jgi:hypothetical protein